MTDALAPPTSTTMAEALPAAKAAATGVRTNQKAGTPQPSMASSILFSRALGLFHAASVISTGFSAKGFSAASTSSMATSPSPSLPLRTEGGTFFSGDRRWINMCSHIWLAMSQSSTVLSRFM